MTDKKTLDLARVFAEAVESRPSAYDEQVRAAADIISSLPDEWVDADTLRNWINLKRGKGLWSDSEAFKARRDLLNDLEALLPAPPTPRTMAEIEWDDAEHHLAEATVAWTEGTTSEVVMLHRNGDTIAVHQSAPHYTGLRELNPAILTPTGRKYRMEPEDDVASATGGELTTQDVVDECRAVRKERAAPESAAPRPEDVPEFDPAYTYRDKDGDEWEYLDGRWIIGTTHANRVAAAREDSPGIDSLLAEFAPYTRIDKENENE